MTGGVRVARIAFFAVAVLFALCVATQVFLAGMSVFVDPAHWVNHTTFVHYFDKLDIAMLILSFAGKLPNAVRWQSGALVVMTFAMYVTANLTVLLPLAGALHPVLALAIFWLAVHLVVNTRPSVVL